MAKKITKENLKKLLDSAADKGDKVIAPIVKGAKKYFSSVKSSESIDFDYIQTAFSPKATFFPSTETLMTYEKKEGNYNVKEVEIPENRVILFGAHPCDAAGLDYLSTFFLKENADKYFQLRKDRTVIISLSCKSADEFCFCTSVGINPYDTKGSDILLTDTNNGSYYLEILTRNGEELSNEFKNLIEESEEIDKKSFSADVTRRFADGGLVESFENVFDSPFWVNQSLACLGCGACAFVCPTCSCFDIQDESTPYDGRRLKCWDTCAIGLFTLHASGHNPREVQNQRWRNRLLHKFNYSVKNLGEISCVGCGRCIRACPAGLDIAESVAEFLGETA